MVHQEEPKEPTLEESRLEECVVKYHEEFPDEASDPLVGFLHKIIRIAIHVLAVLMVFVILWGVGDVIYVLYLRLSQPPLFLLNINDILETFGAFIAVLIAVEIFVNIRLYLGTYTFPVKLVVATALMAISRKIIVLDFEKTGFEYVLASGVVVLALGIVYWLIAEKVKP